jgi:hypothetical protein
MRLVRLLLLLQLKEMPPVLKRLLEVVMRPPVLKRMLLELI